MNWVRDPFENHLARLDLPEPVRALRLELELIARLESVNPFDLLAEPYAASHPFAYPEQLAKELGPYLALPSPGPRLRAWLNDLDPTPTTSIERLGLVARFARHGDSLRLTRWRAALHDRFMLPAVLREDLRAVLEDLDTAGYPFQLAWFEPLLELRFPVLGQVAIGAITLEVRAAHEPCPVLAEEVTPGGIARFIDVANERVQVWIAGMPPDRYVLACNGHDVPLQPLAADGDYVAGLRFKAANPPATLHPTLPLVRALVLDFIDTWTGKIVGGCTYFPAPREPYEEGGSAHAAPSFVQDSGTEAAERPAPPLSLPVARQARSFPTARAR